MFKCDILLLLIIQTSISTPILDDFKTALLKTEDVNQPLINLHINNPDLTAICWAESHIITENKHTNQKSVSKAYSILLDTPGELLNAPQGSENVSCYEILDQDTTPKKILNFTTVKETENYVVKEHKTMFCGQGPLLSQNYIVWPKLQRKRIEISINPLGGHTLRDCNDIETQTTEAKEETTETNEEFMTKNTNQMNVVTKNPIVTAEGLKKDTGISERAFNEDKRSKLKKSLLFRNINCTLDDLGACKEIETKSKSLIGTSNGTKIMLGKWFFPDGGLVRPVDETRSFKLNIRVVVTLTEDKNDPEEAASTELVVEEECLYVVPKTIVAKRRSTSI